MVHFQSPSDLIRHVQEQIRLGLARLGAEIACPTLTRPPREELGDLALECFSLAKSLRQHPQAIAASLAQTMDANAVVERVSAAGPYVNFRLRTPVLARAVLAGLDRPVEAPRHPQHVLIEFSSPNTNKPQHLGHLRNNLLGGAVARILRHVGHRVTTVNLINDRGIHICKSMLTYKKFGHGETPESSGRKGDKLVGDYYVRFETAFQEEYAAWLRTPAAQEHFRAWQDAPEGKQTALRRQRRIARAEQESNAAKRAALLDAVPALWDLFVAAYRDTYFNTASPLGREARDMLVAWERGDAAVRALWERMNGWVYQGFDRTYARLGITFDHVDRESETYLLGKAIVERGLALGVFERAADGSVVCDLAQVGGEGKKVLLRDDGTSVYITQDLGNAYSRFEKFGPDRMIYVVAEEQNYHFEVLFKILSLLRPELGETCYHLAYGMVSLPEGKMKSREGTVVDADDLLDEMQALARTETMERWQDLAADEHERRAEVIGQAAVKYFFLNISPKSAMLFDPKKSIDFNGNTGPYCLYAYARTRNVFNRAGVAFDDFTYDPAALETLQTDEEHAVLMELCRFGQEVATAATELDPSYVAKATYAIARSFSIFYFDRDKHPIINCPDPALRQARLALTQAVGRTIKLGLSLLGIEVLERM